MVAIIISTELCANEIPLNSNHPDQYTVVKNDTLWAIAGKFLKHPWQWPEIWKANDKIKSPQLIYPGDTLYLTIINGEPKMSVLEKKRSDQDLNQSTCILEDNKSKQGRADFSVSKEGKLIPCIRETSLKQAIALIPYDKIAAFLNNSIVVSENELKNVAYIVDIASDHLIAGVDGDKLYANGLTQSEYQTYNIYRKGESYISSDSSEVLGYDLQYIANVSLQKFANPSTLIITDSKSEVLHGDLVMPKTDEEFTLSYFPKPPQITISATIIRIFGGLSQTGSLGVVAIDKGIQDGLIEGHVLSIIENGQSIKDPYQLNKNDTIKLPDEQIGTLMIFRTFERVSYALIMSSTQDVHLLDKVRTP